MKSIKLYFNSICISLLLLLFSIQINAQKNLTNLTKNEQLEGFKVVAIYLNDANNPMGGRFIHQETGFTLDLLQIESVPQVFFYVNTHPVSDMGEPHTQEHLLITKGSKGHELNTREGMSLTRSSAFTSQLYTAYHFYTGAGTTTFYSLFEGYLDALLYPNYTDEEVSREVCNWGVSQNPDKTFRIEEKGSVYNEMSTSMNNPYSLLYNTLGKMLYGNEHPMSYSAGGLPSGIRELNAADILKFHKANYYLGNMGAIVSLSKTEKTEDILNRMNDILTKLNSQSKQVTHTPKKLPAPNPITKGQLEMVDYPSQNLQQPGTMLMAYPPLLSLSKTEYVLLTNFLTVFAGDPTTNLYKIFVNSETRNKDVNAQSVFGYAETDEGNPVFFGLDGVGVENLSKEKGDLARQLILAELKRIAAFKDNSPELIEFNKRFLNGLISDKRSYTKFVNSPPKFGFRNTGGNWYNQLQLLNTTNDFKKSVTLKPEFDEIEKMISSGKKIWKTYLDIWKLTTNAPYIAISKANPELMVKAEKEKKERTENEIADLKKQYKVDNEQEAIRMFKETYDSNTAVLEKSEKLTTTKFIDNPPLTLDDELNYKQEMLPGNIPMLASYFNNMSGATTGIALKLNSVPKDKLVYLALLPELLTQTGIIKEGKTIPYEDMVQMIQKEILSLKSSYSNNGFTNRSELVVQAAGNTVAESQRAIEWMNDVLKNVNWQKENLSRIRDLVEQELSDIRKTMQGREESWVSNPVSAYQFQDQPLQLATNSFLTKTYNIFRLKWMLKDSGNKETAGAINPFLTSLQNAVTTKDALNALLKVMTAEEVMDANSAGVNKEYAAAFNNLPASAKAIAKEAALDLQQMLNDIPDNSMGMDWKKLCHTIQNDLAQTPEKTLDDLNSIRRNLLRNDNTRLFMIASDNTSKALSENIKNLLNGFSNQASSKQNYSPRNLINENVKERFQENETPVFVGLINPDSQTGVFTNSAPLVSYKDTSENELLKFLAAELYAGGGKQSVYTKTTGAGLSYSTGVGANTAAGMFNYYAERTPLLPQTLKFVIDEIKRSPIDPSLLDYTISLAVGGFRSADDYENRGIAMANDLQDGYTPEQVKNFRLAILKLRKKPGVIYDIFKNKDAVYETILPGYGKPSKDVVGGKYFVIGPEKQMEAYEAYLKSVDGNDTKLYRLYPRDFWMMHD
jgi:Zn-dependent M16 (insulinase) family peptidase